MTLCVFLLIWQINTTENRPVLHAALRAPRDEKIAADGKDVVPGVWDVLDKIEKFTDQVRSGKWVSENCQCGSGKNVPPFSSPPFCVFFYC